MRIFGLPARALAGVAIVAVAAALPLTAFGDSNQPPVASSPNAQITDTASASAAATSSGRPSASQPGAGSTTSSSVVPAITTSCTLSGDLQFRSASVGATAFFTCTEPSSVAGLLDLDEYLHGIGWVTVERDQNSNMYPSTGSEPGFLNVPFTACAPGSVWRLWAQWDAVTPEGVIPTRVGTATGNC